MFLRLILSPLREDGKSKLAIGLILAVFSWLGLHSLLSLNGFYTASFDLPPRGFLVLLPPLLVIAVVVILKWKSLYFERLSLSTMTHIHVFRLPLELIVLSGLASAGFIPDIMTFYGNNPDIIVGLTAPIVGYFYFSRKVVSKKVLLWWHIFSLLLLMNISSLAVLSLPYPFQMFGLEQPNIAVLNFPFILLPALLVSVSYFCHIVSIHKLIVFKNSSISYQIKGNTMG